MTAAQTIFAAALALVSALITLFAVYVVSSTVWGDRWYRSGPRPRRGERR